MLLVAIPLKRGKSSTIKDEVQKMSEEARRNPLEAGQKFNNKEIVLWKPILVSQSP